MNPMLDPQFLNSPLFTVPQYILENAFRRHQNCNIIITQPRRIAAITLAKRVALERRCDCGTLVGYQVGLDKQMDTQTNSDTRILFCTTGVLLRKLINEKTMKRYSHVILDEVCCEFFLDSIFYLKFFHLDQIHERDIDNDMLLIVVRRLFATKNPYLKIILMSATLNAEKFANYFKLINDGVYGPAPILDLNIPRPFHIRFAYLDDFQPHPSIVDIDNPVISDDLYKLAFKVIEQVLKKSKTSPSFLVFLPGLHEINRFRSVLLHTPSNILDVSKFKVSILHSSIGHGSMDYANAFDGTVDNKIILATNIAESSVTLPGVRFVIDFCLTKYQETDTATHVTQLKLDWASKMSLEQRAGRVGRIEDGQVIRLIFRDHFEALPKETKPEMQRTSLERVVLQAKQLTMGKPSDVLALALDPPTRSAITDSILMLKEIGGLTRISKFGKFDSNDGDVTFVGLVMGKLPVDVRISKLIFLGHCFSCLEECIIIGSGMSSKSIFISNQSSIQQKVDEYHHRLHQARGSGSDAIAILNAYRSWREELEKGIPVEKLDSKNLHDMHELVVDIERRLRSFHIVKLDDNFRYRSNEKLFMIKMCIAGAFYPNHFQFGGCPPSRDEYRVMNNMSPLTTVFLKRFKPSHIGQLYESQVREMLHANDVTDEDNEMKVKFDRNSERLQVEFKPVGNAGFLLTPGDVCAEVYKAVKFCKLGGKIKLNVMK